MDLNHLLYHHQRALLRAASFADDARPGTGDLVRHYQTRIDRLRQKLGVSHYPDWYGAPAGCLS